MRPTFELSPSGPSTNSMDKRLFSGIWLRWHQLTQSEKVVCGCILGIPLWWLWGWSYLFVLLVVGLFVYEWRNKGGFRLEFPSMTVLALMSFSLYEVTTTYLYGVSHGLSSARDLLISIDFYFCPAILIWYIQSNNIRVRLRVVAWAFSVIVILMTIGFLYVVLINHQIPHNPHRSVFATLTNKPILFDPGQGKRNYLTFYRTEDSSFLGLVRFFYFFEGPEPLAVFMLFVCLLSLDTNNKFWKVSLFVAAFFLLLTSGTRSAWIILPATLLVRFFVIVGQRRDLWFVLALMAVTSFTTLVIPPVTQQILAITKQTANVATQFRADSTGTRAEIYKRTTERLKNSTNRQFF